MAIFCSFFSQRPPPHLPHPSHPQAGPYRGGGRRYLGVRAHVRRPQPRGGQGGQGVPRGGHQAQGKHQVPRHHSSHRAVQVYMQLPGQVCLVYPHCARHDHAVHYLSCLSSTHVAHVRIGRVQTSSRLSKQLICIP